MLKEGEKKEFIHLSQFLRNQIYRGKVSGTYDHNNMDLTFAKISKRNKFNNALIEMASKQINKEGRQSHAKDYNDMFEGRKSCDVGRTQRLQSTALSEFNAEKVILNDEGSNKSTLP